MSQRKTTEELLERIAQADASNQVESVRTLLLVAHPDDETIGASALLGRVKNPVVVYLTDGAPRDPRFRSPHVSGSRDFYACVRAEEAASALSMVGVRPEGIVFLGAVDQEAIHEAESLLEAVKEAVSELHPGIIVTHPYEGGHPDHDTAALIASLVARSSERQGQPVPHILEMTSYHARDGSRVIGDFLAQPAEDARSAVTVKLTQEERARKAKMLGCYVSQWHIVSDFPLEPEHLRLAPAYDFTKPPHEGTLWYETLGWPLTGAQWREMAGRMLARFGELACR